MHDGKKPVVGWNISVLIDWANATRCEPLCVRRIKPNRAIVRCGVYEIKLATGFSRSRYEGSFAASTRAPIAGVHLWPYTGSPSARRTARLRASIANCASVAETSAPATSTSPT